MSDADKPLAELAHAENKIDPPVVAQDPPKSVSIEPGTPPDGWVAPEPETSAVSRLQAFEDEHLGAECVRINGQIERGVGSAYAKMSDAERAQHAALENLVAAEKTLSDAHTALMKADADCEAAAAAVEAAKEKADAVAN